MRDRTPDGVGSEAGEAATPAFATDDGPDTPVLRLGLYGTSKALVDLLLVRSREDLFIERTTPQAPTKPNTRKPARLAIV